MFDLAIPLEQNFLQKKDWSFIIADATWEDYQILLETEQKKYHISYFNNVISIMSPSRNHERIATTISILINAYCRRHLIDYYAFGSSDIKVAPIAGKQPDLSYCFQTEKDTPDLAVEVIFSSGGIKDLDKYKVLKVKEVWFWEKEQLKFFTLINNKYQQIQNSKCLDELNAKFLRQYINRGSSESQLAIEIDFVKALEKNKNESTKRQD